MAIIISSLTPVSPVTVAGATITFVVNATETNGETLEYEWQYSTDGGLSYTTAGLFNNTEDIFTTSPLSQNQSGIYYRVRIENESGDVVFSNEDPDIGDRIVVIEAAPTISVIEEYLPSYTLAIGSNLDLTVEATVANIDLSNPDSLTNLLITWQESSDDGDTWNNITTGTFGQFQYNIETTVEQISTNPVVYSKISTLSLLNLTFSSNNYQYRARLTYPNATNTPTIVPPTRLLLNPTISIFQQPGENATDTKLPVQCYKTSIPDSGQIKVSVGAFTTAGQSLAYSWEFSIVNYDGTMSDWGSLDLGIESFWFRYKTGTNGTTDVLELQRVIYFEQIAFRAIVSGSAGEVPITSNPHYIYMKDIAVQPTQLSNKESLEDFYDPNIIPNSERDLYKDFPIQNVLYESTINVARNTGLNGAVSLQFERQAPNTSTWVNVGSSSTYTPDTDDYTPTPNNNNLPFDVGYTTPPLRIDIDDQSKYRLKVTSTALYTLNNSQKTLVPFYTNISTLTVYRVVYITTQPNDVESYSNQSASFLVGVTTTSSAPLFYQWQDSTSPTTGWANITNGGIYSGATTNLLTLSSVSESLTRIYFRCVVNSTQTISSATSISAKISVISDVFTLVGSLNDFSVDEFQPVSWTVEAQTLSLATISYQWQKSTNFNPSNPSAATWSNISGQTTDTYTIASASKINDEGFYRCRLVSAGGIIEFSNVALLVVNVVQITILQNIPTALTFLEAAENERTFSIVAIASRGPSPTYQWQIRRPGDSTFTDLGLGFNNQQSTGANYTPRAFDAVLDNGAIIRCRITAQDIPGIVFSNQCVITVNRRFFYSADTSTKNVSVGGNFYLNLEPSSTGGIPSFQWQRSTNGGSSWSNISGETSSELLISNVQSSFNGYLYRCRVTLANCTQYQYSRNNVIFVVSVGEVGFTESVTLNIITTPIKPRFYSKESAKSGAAIGTVICVPKPSRYVNDPSATIDDIANWGTSITGDIRTNGTVSSTVSSGSIYNANRPSWVNNSNYRSPKWFVENNRFDGFIELRGQWVLKSDFPLLYKIIGNQYGSTTTLFRLPNPYGKKLMGTGNVNNTGGNVSIIPFYNPDGTLGGDKNIPGSIGGYWNYSKSAQLPPGSPGDTSLPDGTAGVSNAPTFSIGNYTSTGFLECEGVAETRFSGSFTFTVGPFLTANVVSVPPHSHFGISAGFEEGFLADSNGCTQDGSSVPVINPPFYGLDPEGGTFLDGPEGITPQDRGLPHNHSISVSPSPARNGSSNHNDGIGDSAASSSITSTARIETVPGSGASANVFIEPVTIRLTNASRPIFNSSVEFYLKNNEEIPVNSNYFRLKYLIKAY
jgi:hypothetical protein